VQIFARSFAGLLTSSDLNPLDYHLCPATLEKYHKLQPKSKMTDELKVILQTRTRTYQQGGGELHKVLDCLRDCQCGHFEHLQ